MCLPGGGTLQHPPTPPLRSAKKKPRSAHGVKANFLSELLALLCFPLFSSIPGPLPASPIFRPLAPYLVALSSSLVLSRLPFRGAHTIFYVTWCGCPVSFARTGDNLDQIPTLKQSALEPPLVDGLMDAPALKPNPQSL